MELPKETIGEIVRKLIAKDKVYSIYAEDIGFITRMKIPDNELTYSKGTDMVDLERLFIVNRTADDDNEEDLDVNPFFDVDDKGEDIPF